MARTGILAGGAAAVAAAVAGVAGVVAERRVVQERQEGSGRADRLGSLRSDPLLVRADDGVLLHLEIDEARAGAPKRPTLVFVHGYALTLDCWHFQRAALRGRHRMAFYDQRSHGRSERSSRDHATIEQLGDDLAAVLAEVGGPVVLVGHSMGGMTVMSFAERHPETFRRLVVATALISTSAGDLRPHRTLSRWIPDRIGQLVTPRLLAALASAPQLVDSARRAGSNIGYVVARELAFGSERPPAAEVDFLDRMLDGTPFDVLAAFFPTFGTLDMFDVLETFATVPTTVVCGDQDRITSISHSRELAQRIPGAAFLECPGAGHMVIFESRDAINAELADLAERAADA